MPTVFRSKIDAWLAVVLVVGAAASLFAADVALRQASAPALILFSALVALGAALPIWILASTRYTVSGSTLRIRSGPFAWAIPVSSIASIQPTNSPWSSPALSLDRLRIEYGAGKQIVVSPVDQQAFIAAIERARHAG